MGYLTTCQEYPDGCLCIPLFTVGYHFEQNYSNLNDKSMQKVNVFVGLCDK